MSEWKGDAPVDDPERLLATTRAAVLALAAGPILAVGAVLAVPPPPPSGALTAPAALAGIIALAVGHRLYRGISGRTAPLAGPGARLTALRNGTLVSLAVTEATALLGVVAFHLSREPFALAGVAVHLILAGAVWPTRARFEEIRDGPPDAAPGTGDR